MAEPQLDDGVGAAAAEELRGARPASDRVGMAEVRARAERALFGSAEPAKLGRYVLIERIAGGGMGVVYAAYDPQLHRKVALKVLHPRQQADDRAHQRLIAEARALAKLDHPNVVKVHDVITQDGQVVIVMELVEGQTLAAWERARPRSWRAVVEIYGKAGDGLAAAHGVGVVHRDFKPANAIVGDDGRVRVLDFGLARFADGDAGSDLGLASGSPGIEPEMSTSLTATGDVVGTLGFTAPEQLAGAAATAASDQFSFSVALHRALEGEPPFAGTDIDSLAASIRAGTIALARDGRRIPTWLRAVVARGLRAAADARFPAMTAMLGELRRPRGWRRWRGPMAVAAIVGAAGLAIATRPAGSAAAVPCAGGVDEIGLVWNPATRAQIAGAVAAVEGPSARALGPRVVAGLDGYRDRWVELHRDACRAHRRGEQSAELLDRRMVCLARRRVDLRASVDVLTQVDRGTAKNAIDVVARLPDLDACADVERLGAEHEPPATAAMRTQVEVVRAALGRAAALDHAGRSDEALVAATTALADARPIGYPPVVAEAALVRGRVLLMRREFVAAAPQLAEARSVALEQRLLTLAVEAAARLIYAESMEHADLAALTRDAAVFEPLSVGLPGDHFARPLLLNNIGTGYIAAGRRDDAARYFQLARAALVGVAQPDLELSSIDLNVAMVTGDGAERERLSRDVWERRRAALGEAHLETLEALKSYARSVVDPARAVAPASGLCRALDGVHPDRREMRATCHSYRALLEEETGNESGALAIYELIEALFYRDEEHDVAVWGELAAGQSRRLRGDPGGSIAQFQRVVSADRDGSDWWVRARAAEAELGIALAESARGHRDDSVRYLNSAVATYRQIVELSLETEFRLRMTQATRLSMELATRATPRPHD